MNSGAYVRYLRPSPPRLFVDILDTQTLTQHLVHEVTKPNNPPLHARAHMAPVQESVLAGLGALLGMAALVMTQNMLPLLPTVHESLVRRCRSQTSLTIPALSPRLAPPEAGFSSTPNPCHA